MSTIVRHLKRRQTDFYVSALSQPRLLLRKKTNIVDSSFVSSRSLLVSLPPVVTTSTAAFTSTATTTCSQFFSTIESKRPFTILGLQQIAVGNLQKEPMTRLWNDILGLEKVNSHVSETENVDEDILKLRDGIEVDLMTPLDPNKSPKVHIPPLNHIGLWVDDLKSAVDWMKSKGVRFAPGGIRKGASGHDVTFIHPKGNEEFPIGGCGVLIELVQAPPHVIAASTNK